LQQYVQRDHAADQATWAAAAHLIIAGLQGVAGVEATYSACLPNRRPVPCVHVAIDASTVGLRLDQVEARLQEGTPRIFLAPSLVERGILVVNPANLQTSEASIVANCLRQVLRGLGPDAPNSLLCR
jgi:hypothetical protein